MPETEIIFTENTLGDEYQELVQGVENIPHERWSFSCLACRKKGSNYGACIQCVKCSNSIHPSCADQMVLLIDEDYILAFYWYFKES